ncbi:hypothetical protein A5701_10615 [Mycobacterium sp. E3305]|nr:hypothetical protein A5701_10615 [Mycobacterium sp. E3305]
MRRRLRVLTWFDDSTNRWVVGLITITDERLTNTFDLAMSTKPILRSADVAVVNFGRNESRSVAIAAIYHRTDERNVVTEYATVDFDRHSDAFDLHKLSINAELRERAR